MADASLLGRGVFSRGYRAWFLTLSIVISSLAVMDRTSVLTMGQAIKLDLKLTDFQFGIISGFGYALFYAILGLPLARLADTRSRIRLIALAVALFSAFVALCSFARSFIQLFLCRITVGLGEAGVQPPTISMVSDLYPPQARGRALSLLSIGLGLGALVGPIGSGFVAEHANWRIVFLALGAPGVLCGLLAWLTLREPPRGLSEGRAQAETEPAPPVMAIVRLLAGKPTFWCIVVAMAFSTLGSAGVGAFLPQFFARQFQLGSSGVGLLFGVIGALSMLTGMLSGGFVGDWVSRQDRRWYVWLPALGMVVATPLYLGAFLLPDRIAALASLTVAGASLFVYYAPVQVVMQNMVEPRMRGTATYIFFLVSSLAGFGLGPAVLGQLSDHLAGQAFGAGDYLAACPGGKALAAGAIAQVACDHASAQGLKWAMSLMSCLYVGAAVAFAVAARWIRRDLD